MQFVAYLIGSDVDIIHENAGHSTIIPTAAYSRIMARMNNINIVELWLAKRHSVVLIK